MDSRSASSRVRNRECSSQSPPTSWIDRQCKVLSNHLCEMIIRAKRESTMVLKLTLSLLKQSMPLKRRPSTAFADALKSCSMSFYWRWIEIKPLSRISQFSPKISDSASVFWKTSYRVQSLRSQYLVMFLRLLDRCTSPFTIVPCMLRTSQDRARRKNKMER